MHKKQVLALAIPYLLGTFVGIGVGIVGTLVWGPDAQAGSYQFNFNNVEQGPGSTANPSLVINGQEVKKSNGDQTTPATTTQTQVSGDVPSPKVDVTTASATTAPAADLGVGKSLHRSFRLGLLATASDVDTFQSRSSAFGGGLSMTYLPLQGFGIGAFGGIGEMGRWHAGLELEVTPIRLSVFGLNDLLELGVVGGGRYVSQYDEHDFAAHAGVRTAINLGDRFSIAATARTNLSGNAFQSILADAGLTVRF